MSVSLQIDGTVAILTLDDAATRNAFTGESAEAFLNAIDSVQHNADVAALVLRGANGAFCSGAARHLLAAARQNPADPEVLAALNKVYQCFVAAGTVDVPVIAAMRGPAVGAGVNLALAADVRIAGPAALFDPRFQKLGIHPGGGATWMLQRAVGPQVARASLLFGMSFDAEEAVRHGLALRVAEDPVAAARELAAGPANAPREVVIATKASMRATANPGFIDSDQHGIAVDTELGPQARSIESPEFQSRLAAAKNR
jgi:enoyl-CoA hydratase